jgi:DtxR family manganese transport transcriptional regulator
LSKEDGPPMQKPDPQADSVPLPPAQVLPAERSHAARFRKTRVAHSAALSEDYAELIADLLKTAGEARVTDIARHLGVSHATVNKSVNKMKREGLATARPYRGVFLTEAGVALAARVSARHRLVVDLLIAVGVPLEDAEQDAEGIEHYVSEAALRAFERFLGRRRESEIITPARPEVG